MQNTHVDSLTLCSCMRSQVCLAAAASLAIVSQALSAVLQRLVPRHLAASAAKLALRVFLVVTVLLALSRTAALLLNYGAPQHIYSSLPPYDSHERVNVCVGDEWHRFPSSFFLPSPEHRLQFLNSSFRGLLPRPFDPQVRPDVPLLLSASVPPTDIFIP